MSLPRGALSTLGSAAWLQAAQAYFEQHSPESAGNARLECEGLAGNLKFGPLRGKHRLRHALRALLPGLYVPRLQEFRNLEWLRAAGFGAPQPLVAGVVRHRGLPNFQFLATALVEGARDLRALHAQQQRLPDELFATLGSEVARLHARGFVHRDLYPRNILAKPDGAAWQLYFLDAWRGGHGRGLRGAEYDLACLLLFAPLLFTDAQTHGLLSSYLEASGRSVSAPWIASIARQRRLLLSRLIAKGRLRHELPAADWRLPI